MNVPLGMEAVSTPVSTLVVVITALVTMDMILLMELIVQVRMSSLGTLRIEQYLVSLQVMSL